MIYIIKTSIWFTISCFLACTYSYGQCDIIYLNNQEDINNFSKNYSTCTTLESLYIKDTDSDISNFDSLYNIERINDEIGINVNKTNTNKLNLKGFKKLRYIGYSQLAFDRFDTGFPSLDTVKSFLLRYNLNDGKSVFEFVPNLKHIEKEWKLSTRLTEGQTPYFTTGDNFMLELIDVTTNTIDNSTLSILSSRIKTQNLKQLYLAFVKDLDLKYLSIIDSLEFLYVQGVRRCDLSALSELKNISTVRLSFFDTLDNEWGDGLWNTRLDYLHLAYNKINIDYKKIFPNLKSIENTLAIILNDSIFNLSFLDGISPPKNRDFWTIVSIQNNKRLSDCRSRFLCEALENYPEKVHINDNHWKCSKEEILKYCATISSTEDEQAGVIIYPNPSYGIIRIDGLTSSVDIRIFDVQGGVVGTFHNASGQLDISHLPSGLYIIKLSTGKEKSYQRIVKMD